MEVRANGYVISQEGLKCGPMVTYFDDIISVKIKEGSRSYSFKYRNRPLTSSNNIPKVNIRVGNTRINTTGNNNSRNSVTSMTLKVREEEVQTVHQILTDSNLKCEERNIKYGEAKGGLIAISLIIFFVGIIFGLMAPSSMDLPSFLTTPVIVGIVAAIAVGLNIFGMATMNKDQKIKVYS